MDSCNSRKQRTRNSWDTRTSAVKPIDPPESQELESRIDTSCSPGLRSNPCGSFSRVGHGHELLRMKLGSRGKESGDHTLSIQKWCWVFGLSIRRVASLKKRGGTSRMVFHKSSSDGDERLFVFGRTTLNRCSELL